jgi:plastocyanin
MRRFALPLLVLCATLVSAACSGTSTSPSAAAPSTPASSPATSAAASDAASDAASPATTCEKVAEADITGTTVAVEIKDFKFSPQPVTAKVGDAIVFTNSDSAPHTATLDDGACDTESIAAGAKGALVFNAAGTYTYHCTVHPSQMKDFTIEVQ